MEIFIKLYGIKVGLLIIFCGLIWSGITYKKFVSKLLGFRQGLDKYWWHRLIKVVFFVLTIIFSLVIILLAGYKPKLDVYNTNIINNLAEYTKTYSIKGSSIPDFVKLSNIIGCVNNQNHEITEISDYYLETYGYCSPSLFSNIGDATNHLNSALLSYEKKYTSDDFLNLIKNEYRTCLISKTYVDCPSSQIVSLKINTLFYTESAVRFVMILFIWIIFWLLVYYRGFLYIMLGKNKNK